jgi:hypothetical protein
MNEMDGARKTFHTALNGLDGFRGTAIAIGEHGEPTVAIWVSADNKIPALKNAIDAKCLAETYEFKVVGSRFKAFDENS